MGKWSRRGFLKFMGMSPALKGLGIDLSKYKHVPKEDQEAELVNVQHGVTLKIDGVDYTDLAKELKVDHIRGNIDVTSVDDDEYRSLLPTERFHASLYADKKLLSIKDNDIHKIEIGMNGESAFIFDAIFTDYRFEAPMDDVCMVYIEMAIIGPISNTYFGYLSNKG